MSSVDVRRSDPKKSMGASPRRLPDAGTIALIVVLIGVVVAGTVTTDGFLTAGNIRAVLIEVAIIGLLAVSMTPLTLSGNVVSLATQQQTLVAAAMFLSLSANQLPAPVVLLAVFGVQVALGVVQGIIVATGLDPIITTLATAAILFGALDRATAGGPVTAPADAIAWVSGSAFGVPAVVLAFVAVTVIVTVVSHTTVLGRSVILTGANRDTARLSGVNVFRVTVIVFVVLAMGCAVAGIMVAGQVGQVTANAYGDLSLSVVAAVLVGGTSAKGGSGSPIRSAIGAVLIGLLGNVMVLHGLSTGWRLLAQGAIVVVIVVLVHMFSNKESK